MSIPNYHIEMTDEAPTTPKDSDLDPADIPILRTKRMIFKNMLEERKRIQEEYASNRPPVIAEKGS